MKKNIHIAQIAPLRESVFLDFIFLLGVAGTSYAAFSVAEKAGDKFY